MTASMPRHIAFIMDGNGRWAQRQGLPRIRGHERGAEVLREVVRFCASEGIEEVTFYALSTENYRRRPEQEVQQLMDLLLQFLVQERQEINENRLRFRAIGRIDEFPDPVVEELQKTVELSRDNDGMVLRLALNYGGRREITDAVAGVVREIAAGKDPAEFAQLDEAEFARYLYEPGMTDPDLLVRTAGEYRISNFLLWHISYAELWVTEAPWPDFGVALLRDAIASYSHRERRFGTVTSVAEPDDEATT